MACSLDNTSQATVAARMASVESVASNAIDAADRAIFSLGDSKLGYVWMDSPELDENFLKTYNPTASKPTFSHSLNLPNFNITAPILDSIPYISFGDAPELDVEKPTMVMPAAPNPIMADKPTTPSIDTTLILPAAPVISDIPSPTLHGISIPTIPELDLPVFSGISPDSSGIDLPSGTFSFTEVQYTSDVLSDVDSLVQQMLSGGVGIPDNVWDSIWQRGREQLSKEAEKSISQINNEWSSRGFSMPQGVQAAQIKEIRESVLSASAEYSRELAIKHAEHKVQNLQFAVQQGIAFETIRGAWHEQEVARALDAAKLAYQATIDIFQAGLSLHNAEIQLYNIESVIYKSLIEAEIMKLEEQRLELQAQSLIKEINQSEIELYKAKHEALTIKVQNYKAQVDAAVSTLESAKTQAVIYGHQIQAYGEEIKAGAMEYDAYKTQVEAEGIKFGAYETAVKAFGAETDAYKTNVEAKLSENNAIIENNKQRVLQFETNIARFDTNLKAEIQGLSAYADAYKAKAMVYETESRDKQFITNTEIQSAQNQLRKHTNDVGIATSNAQQRSETLRTEGALNSNAAQSVAKIYSGLAASSLSAMSISASIRDDVSTSCRDGV